MKLILKYFPDLSDTQYRQMAALEDLYKEWNEKINVVSRKDIDQLYLRHVLHSLALYKWMPFQPGTSILDLGCGGGFPGIPLAIMMPDVNFKLIDARGKKIKVVIEVAEALGLNNVKAEHRRVEEEKGKFHFVITRAVAPMAQLWEWSAPRLSGDHFHKKRNGVIALKGGDLMDEMEDLPRGVDFTLFSLATMFDEDFFETKMIAYAYKIP
jgi:16S rRNA (guanine527-N7)-methyltransferase